MFKMFLDADQIRYGNVIAITSPDFKDECENHGWIFLERGDTRVGNKNADLIEKIIRELCE